MLSINAIHFVTSATGSWLEKTKKKIPTFSGIKTPVFRISSQCFATWTITFAIQLELDDEDGAGFNHSSYFAFKFFSGKQKNIFQKKKFFCRIETRIRKIGILKIPQFFANFSFFIGWSINFIFFKNNSFGSKLNIRERLWMNDVCQFVWPLAVWPQESTVALKCNPAYVDWTNSSPVLDRNSQ